MSDGGKLVPVKEVAAAVATIVKEVPIYPDAVQPAAREFGQLAAAPISFLNTALRPVKTIMLGFNLVFDNLDARLRARLAGVPVQKVVEPPASVAGPLLLAYPFVESEPPLREMFEQLLATAMNADLAERAHPSYVEVIKQLTADEATLVRWFALPERASEPAAVPAVEMRMFWPAPRVDWQQHGRLFHFSGVQLSIPDRIPTYVSNLARLGLVEVIFDRFIAGDEPYAAFETMLEAERLREAATLGRQLSLARGVAMLTAFGISFIKACVEPTFELRDIV